MPTEDQLRRARKLVLEYGWNATAYQILNPGLKLWFPRAVDKERGGFIQDYAEDWSEKRDGNKTLVYQARLTWMAAQVSENAPNPAGVAGAPSSQPVSDAAITAAVKSKLLADTTVGGLKINVDTRDGVVSLSGPVKSQTEKDTALRIARETSGVRDVLDNLIVQTG